MTPRSLFKKAPDAVLSNIFSHTLQRGLIAVYSLIISPHGKRSQRRDRPIFSDGQARAAQIAMIILIRALNGLLVADKQAIARACFDTNVASPAFSKVDVDLPSRSEFHVMVIGHPQLIQESNPQWLEFGIEIDFFLLFSNQSTGCDSW